MIEYHDIEPVRIIVVIKRNGRSGIDDGFIRISGIQLVLTLFFQNLDVMNPIIIKRGDHDFWR